MSLSKEKIAEFGREYKIPFYVFLLYAILIFTLSELLIWVLSLKPVQLNINNFIRAVNLDIFLSDFYYSIKPYFSEYAGANTGQDGFSVFKDWSWAVAYAFFSFLTGIVHAHIFRLAPLFETFTKTSFCLLILKTFSLTVPYGVVPVFWYLSDFINMYHPVFISVFFVCFLFLFIGSETAIFWRRNINPGKNTF